MFRCSPYNVILSISACAARSSAVLGRHRIVLSRTCKACPVGAAHARGELPATWEDGAPIVRVSGLSAPETIS